MASRLPVKKQVLLDFLDRGVAMVHLDARRPGVVVPAQHRTDPHLKLNLSYRYRIPDLVVGDEQVQASLSFGGQHFRCRLPWEAVFAITSQATGDGQVWPEDLPVELAGVGPGMQPPPEPARPVLAAVEDEATAGERPQRADDAPPKRHLRLVR